MTTDDSKAALAAALRPIVSREACFNPNWPEGWAGRSAAAILAALDGWRLVPADTSLAYDTGFQDGLLEAAEIHRLPADAVSVDAHKPGDHHRYRVVCEVCGAAGQLRLTVDPEES